LPTLATESRSATPAWRRRHLRLALAIAGLAGLALVSFAIALALWGGGSRPHAPLADAPALAIPTARLDAQAAPPLDAPGPADAAVATGILDIRTVPPGGKITVGDQTHTAPAQLLVAAGQVTVVAELAGYPDERRELYLEPGEHHEVEIAFDRPAPQLGKLTVRTTPASEVYEGGALIATTPFADRPMAAGVHTLVFRNAKHATIEKKVTIVAGKTLRLIFPLP
jgi:hypothetical protein